MQITEICSSLETVLKGAFVNRVCQEKGDLVGEVLGNLVYIRNSWNNGGKGKS